jgi:ORF6N domain
MSSTQQSYKWRACSAETSVDKQLVLTQRIVSSIRWIRGHKVLLDSDLASLYGVTTGNLNKAVKRNASRFPADFMFRLTKEDMRNLRFQFGISTWGGRRVRPYAFAEQGVAMLSSVLKSERAVKVNIAIMRAFVRLREALETNRELAQKFAELERRVGKHDEEIAAILEAIRQLMAPTQKPRREIGFHVREKPGRYRARNGR